MNFSPTVSIGSKKKGRIFSHKTEQKNGLCDHLSMVRGDVCAKKLLEFAKKWGKKEWIVCKTGIIITSTFKSFLVRVTTLSRSL